VEVVATENLVCVALTEACSDTQRGNTTCLFIIEVDPKKIGTIKRIQTPSCKKEVQNLLGKINYL
jgi:hypothetical protein